MGTWTSIVLAFLKLSLAIVGWLNSKQMMDAGQDKAIAKAALDVAMKTDYGKRLRDSVKAMDDSDADQLWDDMLNA